MVNIPVRSKSSRRLFRLSLRTLMLAIVAIAAALGWAKHRADVQRDAIAAIRRGGGDVVYDYQFENIQGTVVVNEAALPNGPRWLFDWLGPDYLVNVEAVGLGPGDAAPVMAHVGRLSRLKTLDAGAYELVLTDADMVHLRGLTKLERLILSSPNHKITGSALTHLKGMTRLKELCASAEPFNYPQFPVVRRAGSR